MYLIVNNLLYNSLCHVSAKIQFLFLICKLFVEIIVLQLLFLLKNTTKVLFEGGKVPYCRDFTIPHVSFD